MAKNDEVDRIVDAWEREHPNVDFRAMHVLSRVDRLAKQLDNQRKAAFGATGLEVWEFDVLSALRRAGVPNELSAKKLMSENMVSSGAMTNRINRLIERGLVERFTDPADRRGILVKMTELGREKVDRSIQLLMVRETELLHTLNTDERTELSNLLRKLSLDFD
ncbi:MAG: MarR family transcriptional regulator [Microbacteriaceae bacterium]